MSRATWSALLWLIGTGEPVLAQSVLYVEHEGRMLPVRAARESRAMVELDGKQVRASGEDFALKKANEYLPVLVKIHDWESHSSYMGFVDTADRINSRLHVAADFESAYQLEDVFLVLSFQFNDQTKGLFLHEVGRIDAYKPLRFSRSWPLAKMPNVGQYELHLFAAGREVLHTQMPEDYREGVLAQMVSRRIAGVPVANVKRFVGPVPQYPVKLMKSAIAGSASVRLGVGITGAVVDPEVVGASEPAFGEAALAAVRESRFLPRIENGRPIEARITVPFEFKPPRTTTQQQP